MSPTTILVLVLVSLVGHNEAISSAGAGIHGKKRNELPGNQVRNRFLCPGCKREKELRELETVFDNSAEKKEIHCVKGDRGGKGEPGESGKISQAQIDAVIKPLEAKLEALKSSYTVEIARLKSEMQNLKNSVLHSLGSKSNPAISCKEILKHDGSSPSGMYYLNVTGVTGGVTASYCSMDEDLGCPVGSTLVMKIDGSKDTFPYSSPLWSNKQSYNPNNGGAIYDSKETKLATYWSTPLTKVCITMRVESWDMESLIIDHRAKSLYDILADGTYRPTKGTRNVWQSILPGSGLSKGCLRQGFNAHGSKEESAAARIGAIAGDKSDDCSSFDSFIGLGTKGGSCGTDRRISCGYESGCHGDKHVQAFGYVFVY